MIKINGQEIVASGYITFEDLRNLMEHLEGTKERCSLKFSGVTGQEEDVISLILHLPEKYGGRIEISNPGEVVMIIKCNEISGCGKRRKTCSGFPFEGFPDLDKRPEGWKPCFGNKNCICSKKEKDLCPQCSFRRQIYELAIANLIEKR